MTGRDFRIAVLDENESLESLSAAWMRSFLNYTPEAPGVWRDPEQQYTGNLDHPDCALPYLLRLLREQGRCRETLDQVLAYLQFYAAVRKQNYPGTDTAQIRELIAMLPDQAELLLPLRSALE